MQRLRRNKTLRKFVSVHASLQNHFNSERRLADRHAYQIRRSDALAAAGGNLRLAIRQVGSIG